MSTISNLAADRLIVALDLPTVGDARRIVDELEGQVSFFKIGLVLQLADGVGDFIRDLISRGKRVFLDYKYFDIDATVESAVRNAARLGVSFLTIHGTSQIIRAAVKGRGQSDLKLLAVTVLTSMDKADLHELGYPVQSVEELVLFRAKKALEAGCDGVIASGQEASQIKKLSAGKLLVATPGIRPDGSLEDEQKRRMTPREAIMAGADYLVVGRPICKPDSGTIPQAAARVLADMQAGIDESAVKPL